MRIFETCRKFDLDDGTGRIKAQQWNNGVDFESGLSQLDVNAFPYVRIIGAIKQYKDENIIIVARLDVVSSPYEPYHHILQAIHDTLAYERGPPPQHISQIVQTTDLFDGDAISTLLPPKPLATRNSALRVPHFTQRSSKVLQGEHSLSTPVLRDQGKCTTDLHINELSIPKVNSVQVDKKFSPSISTLGADFTSQHSGSSVTPVKRSSWTHNLSGNASGESLLPSSLLSWSPSPVFGHQLQKTSPRDPYSHLSSLQCDILCCITAARDQNAGQQGIYPSTDDLSPKDCWEGLDMTAIIRAVSMHRPKFTAEVFLASVEELIKEGHVFCPINDSHYSCI